MVIRNLNLVVDNLLAKKNKKTVPLLWCNWSIAQSSLLVVIIWWTKPLQFSRGSSTPALAQMGGELGVCFRCRCLTGAYPNPQQASFGS